mgnify:CR=1 FL=1
MNITINTLLWDNLDPRMVESHKAVYDHFDLPVSYTLWVQRKRRTIMVLQSLLMFLLPLHFL